MRQCGAVRNTHPAPLVPQQRGHVIHLPNECLLEAYAQCNTVNLSCIACSISLRCGSGLLRLLAPQVNRIPGTRQLYPERCHTHHDGVSSLLPNRTMDRNSATQHIWIRIDFETEVSSKQRTLQYIALAD